MTKAEAEQHGYAVIEASVYEWGLTKDGKGLRTWWRADFPKGKPDLDHPIVTRAINANEDMLKMFTKP